MITALYTGTFDPVHFGHLDLMKRGAVVFDKLIVAVYDHKTPTKSLLFSVDERVQMIEEALQESDRGKNITVTSFSGLAVDFARAINATVFLRGLRVFSDFEFEFRLALANKRLAPEIETVSLITDEDHTFLSGTTVREIASLGGDVSSMVSPNVAEALYNRFNGKNPNPFNRPVPLRD
ncbi:MAG: pantetheine-phosphate adenylyltransferase [Chloroflexi bacterium]|nr:pantetheine-phosphate adenylyltransferase [Chloroflexota bacterium]